MLGWLVEEKAIAPHIPVFETGRRQDGAFSRRDFLYNPDEDCYICPGGKALKQYCHAGRAAKAKPPKDGFLRYWAQKADCDVSALKLRCTPKEPMRKVLRNVHEEARDPAGCIAETEAFAQSRRQRKKVEMLFAHLKRILKLDQLRLRGPTGAQDELTLAAIAQNLRKLAKLAPAIA